MGESTFLELRIENRGGVWGPARLENRQHRIHR